MTPTRTHGARGRTLALVLLCAALLAAGAPGIARGQDTPAATPGAPPASDGRDWSEDAVCYEVFVRSLADSDGDGIGDLVGLTGRLDYLNDGDPATAGDLGVTCVWLMPVMAATSYHGYDVEDAYAVEPDYGTADDFRRFAAEAHRRGIRIVLDLVLNHTSSGHPWFREALADPASPYREWYIFERADPAYAGPDGQKVWHRTPAGDGWYYGLFQSGMPDLDYRNPAVTEEARKIAAFWLGEMGADGFRLDAVKHLIEDGERQVDTAETHAWLRDFQTFVEGVKPDVYTVGEVFNASAAALEPYYPDHLDAYFQFEFGPQIVQAVPYGSGSSLLYTVEDTQ